MVKDEDDEKRLAPSDFLLFTSAGNFANLILSDSLTLIKLHDLHAPHHSSRCEEREIFIRQLKAV